MLMLEATFNYIDLLVEKVAVNIKFGKRCS